MAVTLALASQVSAHVEGHGEAATRSKADLERDLTSKPYEIMNFAGVKKGDKVLDFLGGGGYYSQLLSEQVGASGLVVLHNNQAYIPYVGKELDERFSRNNLNNITRLMSEASDLKFGEDAFDKVFLVLGYHDFFYDDTGWSVRNEVVMPQVYKAMKKGATLLVIDHSAVDGAGDSQTKALHRIEESFAVKSLEKLGFTLLKSSNLLRNPDDSRSITVFDPSIRRKTDRFVLLFQK